MNTGMQGNGLMTDSKELLRGAKSFAGVVDDPRALRVGFDRPVTDSHRAALLEAINAALITDDAQSVGMREALIEQCAKIAEPWSGFITGDKMGAMDSAIVEVREEIAAAIRAIASKPPAATVGKSNAGFFGNLTPEQQKTALEYDGPENHGDPAHARSSAGNVQAIVEALRGSLVFGSQHGCQVDGSDSEPDIYVNGHMNLTALAQAVMNAVPQTSVWQPIETAPKDGTHIWAYQDGRYQYECWWKDDLHYGSYWMDDADSEPDPTHWRTLPEVPSPVSRPNLCGGDK